MNIDTQLLKTIRPQIEAALADLGKEHGITFHCANAKYSSLEFTFQLKGEVIDAGDGKSKAQVEWENQSNLLGLGHVSFGAKFRTNMRLFTITGIDLGKPKYPVLGADEKGKGFKFQPETILHEYPKPAEAA
ncbi:MAG: hypothetical protein V3S33_02255 [Gammaproteobacteria bacterium]